MGVNDLDGTDKDSQQTDFKVIEQIIHPEYRDGSHYNDIGLIRLDRPVQFNHYIRPACLPKDGIDSELPNNVIAIGYGLTSKGGLQGSNKLLKVILETFNHKDCQDAYRQLTDSTLENGITESQICAGSRDEDKNTCEVRIRNLFYSCKFQGLLIMQWIFYFL